MLTAEWRMRNKIGEQQEFRSQEIRHWRTKGGFYWILNSGFWILFLLFTIHKHES